MLKKSRARLLIKRTAKKCGILEVKKLIELVYADYQDTDISKLTVKDIYEIADASGIQFRTN